MDNVIQNISINDIISKNLHTNEQSDQKINRLAELIRNYGIINPILVRPKGNKYEIILGVEEYQAAKKAKLYQVPVLVREVSDKIFKEYSDINNDNKSIVVQPRETFFSEEKGSDIINLSALNNTTIEYERDDSKMNNEQLNNNLSDNNLGQQQLNSNQAPAFGGKFFPSLEDEPTNMNMNATINQPIIGQSVQQTPNNNLIDLTDLSGDKEPLQGNQPILPTSEPVSSNIDTNLNAMPATDNILNINNLQNNNPSVTKIPEPVSMEILNSDFGAPAPQTDSQLNSVPEINVGQSINNEIPNLSPVPEVDQLNSFAMPQVTPDVNNNYNPIPDFGINTNTVTTPIPAPIPDLNQNIIPQVDNVLPQPMMDPIQSQPINQELESITNNTMEVNNQKDTIPALNMIKNIATSLEGFGYRINITEEDTAISSKITIEVEK